MASAPARVLRFGLFEADLDAGELRKHGRLVRLQQQPFDVLRALLDHPGQLVTRESLHKRLWPDGVTVDFDQSLNKSVTKLRDALGDTADSPTFIETLPKRGYRFIAEVHPLTPPAPAMPPAPRAEVTPAPVSSYGVLRAADSAPRVGTAPIVHRGWSAIRWLPLGGLAGVLALLATLTTQRPVAEPLTPRPVAPAVPTMSADAAAVDAYERGRVAAGHRSAEGLRSGVASFERALAADPRFAAAYVALADASSLLASDGYADPKTMMPRAREAANRALTLDPSMGTAHASLGRTTMLFDWDWKIALWHFERARELAPSYGIGRQWFAYCYAAMGDHTAAEQEAQAALTLEPLSLAANTTLGYVLYNAKRYADAETQLRRALELDPGYVQAHRVLGLTLVKANRPADAVVTFERAAQIAGETPSSLADLAMARGRAGDAAGAKRLLTRLLDLQGRSAFVAPDGLAQVYWGLGDLQTAIAWLQRAYEARVATVAHLMADPLWDDLRPDPRVGAMIEGIENGKAPAAPLP
jgi:DNA-binding winged helix-turn-helix (wHTH) protein/tetratricopeptide (TPR) repeat protein